MENKKYYTLVSWYYEKRQGIRVIRKTESRVFKLASSRDALYAVADFINYKGKGNEKLSILSICVVSDKTQVNG